MIPDFYGGSLVDSFYGWRHRVVESCIADVSEILLLLRYGYSTNSYLFSLGVCLETLPSM